MFDKWSVFAQLQSEELRMREARHQSDRIQLEQRLSQLQIKEEHLQLTYARLALLKENYQLNFCRHRPLFLLCEVVQPFECQGPRRSAQQICNCERNKI